MKSITLYMWKHSIVLFSPLLPLLPSLLVVAISNVSFITTLFVQIQDGAKKMQVWKDQKNTGENLKQKKYI